MNRILKLLSCVGVALGLCVFLLVGAQPAVAKKTKPPAAPPAAAEEQPLPTIAEKVEDLERREGLLVHYLDPKRGKVWVEVPPGKGDRGQAGRYIYVEGLLGGLGSNPVGLDRGQLGPTRLIVLRRVGNRVLIEQPNLAFRALTDNPLETRAVRDSFATSILWTGEIAAVDPNGRALVDFTSFLVRDAHGVATTLKQTGQGTYSLDPVRSVVDFRHCLSFPDNVEFEALLTFAGSEPGGEVRSVAPTPESITLAQHHSIVRLPARGYRPREFDPRAGSFAIWFMDYAAELDEPLERRWIVRHRLQKTDPGAARSRVVEPIVYYVDRGTPEPVRSALVEGASWWAEAFEAAGFIDSFRVELLPEGAHPLDTRYNVIQWVHRSTRGWSYGGGVTDPRTGEMIKGHVSLGSLRVRQDRLLFEGLLGTQNTGKGGPDDPIELALARIRQLSAHEVGHTLGLAHNFAASTYAGRASVMDYPAPLVRVREDGTLDVSEAYGVGVGAWDVHAVRWAYSELDPEDEAERLEAIVREGIERGLRFVTDRDARPAGAAHPLANLWDNGDNPVEELGRLLEVRRVALGRFGERNVLPGTPLALLQEVLVPVYFHHRYQLDAAIKVLGGMEYDYVVAGDGRGGARMLDPEWQRRALEQVLAVLTPDELDLPDSVLDVVLPRPFGYGRNRELFEGRSDPVFDPLAATEAAAGAVVGALLQPERCNRLVDFHRRDAEMPSLEGVLERLVMHSFQDASAAGTSREAALQHVIQQAVVDGLIRLSADPRASRPVKARVDWRLGKLAGWLEASRPSETERAQRLALKTRIERYLSRGLTVDRPADPGVPMPPGSPIGDGLPVGLPGCSQPPGSFR